MSWGVGERSDHRQFYQNNGTGIPHSEAGCEGIYCEILQGMLEQTAHHQLNTNYSPVLKMTSLLHTVQDVLNIHPKS